MKELDSAGGFFGALFMFFSLEQLGRKWTVIISDAIFAVGAVLCTVATNQLGLMYAGRLLTGLGVGGIAAVSSESRKSIFLTTNKLMN